MGEILPRTPQTETYVVRQIEERARALVGILITLNDDTKPPSLKDAHLEAERFLTATRQHGLFASASPVALLRVAQHLPHLLGETMNTPPLPRGMEFDLYLLVKQMVELVFQSLDGKLGPRGGTDEELEILALYESRIEKKVADEAWYGVVLIAADGTRIRSDMYCAKHFELVQRNYEAHGDPLPPFRKGRTETSDRDARGGQRLVRRLDNPTNPRCTGCIEDESPEVG